MGENAMGTVLVPQIIEVDESGPIGGGEAGESDTVGGGEAGESEIVGGGEAGESKTIGGGEAGESVTIGVGDIGESTVDVGDIGESAFDLAFFQEPAIVDWLFNSSAIRISRFLHTSTVCPLYRQNEHRFFGRFVIEGWIDFVSFADLSRDSNRRTLSSSSAKVLTSARHISFLKYGFNNP